MLKISHKKNKKGVDAIISYVLLITLGLSLAVFVFNWLRGFVPNQIDDAKCPDGVSLILSEVPYLNPLTGLMDLEVQNRGRFNVSGFFVRVNNVSEPNLGIYLINRTDFAVGVGETKAVSINYSRYYIGTEEFIFNTGPVVVEIQPFVYQKGHSGKIPCEGISRVSIS